MAGEASTFYVHWITSTCLSRASCVANATCCENRDAFHQLRNHFSNALHRFCFCHHPLHLAQGLIMYRSRYLSTQKPTGYAMRLNPRHPHRGRGWFFQFFTSSISVTHTRPIPPSSNRIIRQGAAHRLRPTSTVPSTMAPGRGGSRELPSVDAASFFSTRPGDMAGRAESGKTSAAGTPVGREITGCEFSA